MFLTQVVEGLEELVHTSNPSYDHDRQIDSPRPRQVWINTGSQRAWYEATQHPSCCVFMPHVENRLSKQKPSHCMTQHRQDIRECQASVEQSNVQASGLKESTISRTFDLGSFLNSNHHSYTQSARWLGSRIST